MKFNLPRPLLWCCLLSLTLSCACAAADRKPDFTRQRSRAGKAMKAGNYRDALELYRVLLRDSRNPQANQDLPRAVDCLKRLNRLPETDELLAETLSIHDSDWPLLEAAANCYIRLPHWGYKIDGQFRRGPHRGGGTSRDSAERDCVRALQLMSQALHLLPEQLAASQRADFLQSFARVVRFRRTGSQVWRLQELTDLEKLPECEKRQYGWRRAPLGAPVAADGTPVFYHIPETFRAARNDGERWRWLLHQARTIDSRRANSIHYEFAHFLWQQFGVQTMRSLPIVPFRADDNSKPGSLAALSTLEENETLAQLATGARRFALPAEFNFIRRFRQIADSEKSHEGRLALEQLARIFANRRQYTKAAEMWQRCIEIYGPGANKRRRRQLEQIIGNWGEFEADKIKPAGTKAAIVYRFRNGRQVAFKATRIRVRALLEDVKAYIKSNPKRLKYDKLNLHNIGWRLVHENETKYLGRQVASWTTELTPRPGHYDTRATIDTPLAEAGAYLVTATLQDGNTSRIILWLADTVISEKQLDQQKYYFVADAVTGAPIPGATLDFFGYRQQHRRGRRYEVQTREFRQNSDTRGQVIPDAKELLPRHNWLITATTPEGRFAFMGFRSVWYPRHRKRPYHRVKAFAVTDRPVYRPGQSLFFKVWIRRARYDQEDTSAFANQNFTLVITNPKGEKLLEKSFRSDSYGGIAGDCQIPADATLGLYRLHIPGKSGGVSTLR